MAQNINKKHLIDAVVDISKEAGKAILEIYYSDFNFSIKKDSSPITKADQISHQIITQKLRLLTPNIPILSEEDSDIPFNERSKWKKYWLVDPLDGTKEFIKKNGEFTVNIALIDNHLPVLGIIYVPVSNQTYWGSINLGSFYIQGNSEAIQIYVSQNSNNPLTIATSASHPSKNLSTLLEKIKNYKIIKKGSSIKLCLVASGEADVYLRLGPTSEWDIAAGDAIIKFAGGNIVSISGEPLSYNLEESFLNPQFIAYNNDTNKSKFLSLLTEQ